MDISPLQHAQQRKSDLQYSIMWPCTPVWYLNIACGRYPCIIIEIYLIILFEIQSQMLAKRFSSEKGDFCIGRLKIEPTQQSDQLRQPSGVLRWPAGVTEYSTHLSCAVRHDRAWQQHQIVSILFCKWLYSELERTKKHNLSPKDFKAMNKASRILQYLV